MRVHIGCGSVYLSPDWVNLDIRDSGSALAKDSRYGREYWETTEDQYYAKQTSTLEQLTVGIAPNKSDTICDCYGSWQKMPFDDSSVDEILARQCFEHLSITEARLALQETVRVMKVGGILRISVPDMEETLEQYRANGSNLMHRHILGTRRSDVAYHCVGWTRKSLDALCGEYGFEFVSEERNIHFYPAFCLRMRLVAKREQAKPWGAAWQYAGNPLGTPLLPDVEHGSADNRILEVGCGTHPWPFADTFVDADPACEAVVDAMGRSATFHVGDVQNLPEEWTGRFQCALCSHCIEHVEDPQKAFSELQRVAAAGTVVMPSGWKDSIMNWHEQDHKWCVLPYTGTGFINFLPLDNWVRNLHSPDVAGWMHRLFRYRDQRIGADADKLADWFHQNEPKLDVILRFSPGNPLPQVRIL